MPVLLDEFGFNGITYGNITTPMLDVSPFESFKIFIFCDHDCDIQYRWSSNGIVADLTDLNFVNAGNTISLNSPVKAKFLSLFYGPYLVVLPAQLRVQLLFQRAPAGLSSLVNVGGGAEVFIPSTYSVRTLISSDNTVTITQGTSTVNLSSASAIRTLCTMQVVAVTNAAGYYGTGESRAGTVDGANTSYYICAATTGEINRIRIHQGVNSTVDSTYTLYNNDVATAVVLTVIAGAAIADWSGTYAMVAGDRLKMGFSAGPVANHSISTTISGIESY